MEVEELDRGLGDVSEQEDRRVEEGADFSKDVEAECPLSYA